MSNRFMLPLLPVRSMHIRAASVSQIKYTAMNLATASTGLTATRPVKPFCCHSFQPVHLHRTCVLQQHSLPYKQRRIARPSSSRLHIAASTSGGSKTPSSASKTPSQQVNNKNYSAASAASVSNTTGTGVFILLLLNLIIFVMDHTFHLPQIQRLYLDHLAPRWWQFLTSSFCHASWAHLSNNTFLLYVFGKIVEEEEGLWGVWFTYIITAVGASIASYLLQPKATISLGASGAVFGLFAVSVLVKLSFNLKKLIECGILGQFVIKQLLQETASLKGGGTVIAGHSVGHIAHLAGALAGVMLVYSLSRLPAVSKH